MFAFSFEPLVVRRSFNSQICNDEIIRLAFYKKTFLNNITNQRITLTLPPM